MFTQNRRLFWLVAILWIAFLLPIFTVSIANGQGAAPITPGPQSPESVPNPGISDAQVQSIVNRPLSPQKIASIVIQNNKKNENPLGSQTLVPANGQRLLANPYACNNFDGKMTGSGWEFQYGGWGIWAENAPDLQRRREHLTFTPDTAIANIQSIKIGMDKPAHGLLVSPHFKAPAGARIIAKVSYIINVGNTANKSMDNRQWASIHVKPVNPNDGQYTAQPTCTYFTGEWKRMSSEMTMVNDGEYQVVLEGINDSSNDTQVYFDNVEIWMDINGKMEPKARCVLAGD